MRPRHTWTTLVSSGHDTMVWIERAARNGWEVELFALPGYDECLVVATDRRGWLARRFRPLPPPQRFSRKPAGVVPIHV